ncbi:MAG: serine/threonine protein kinase [Rhodomicrobium sp.]|nr:MAG: serine/threonine protein kinase [Rhodomicrobium sp.]
MALPTYSAKAESLQQHFNLRDEAANKAGGQLAALPDHSGYTKILKSVIKRDKSGLNRVDYKKLKNHRPALKAYIDQLSRVKLRTLPRDAQFSFWANLYNALTLKVVEEAYPVATIRDIDISPGLFANGPWGKKLITIEGKSLSLDDIEHQILRKVFKDPRVHYAVNCASVGCPNLQPEAFTGQRLQQQLESAAKEFVNSNQGVSIKNGKIGLSKIYSWFQKDFGGSEAKVRAHISKYLTADKAAVFRAAGQVDDYFYDWTLNDTAR